MMQRTTIGLTALLVAQLGVAAGLAVRHGDGHAGPPSPLLAFDAAKVDQLSIQERGQPPLVIRKEGKKWVLPGLGDAPADGAHAAALVTALAGLKAGWPVATSPEAAKRFKVADGDFERRIEIGSGGGSVGRLLVGSAPSYRLAEVRVEGKTDIYTVPFDSYSFGGKAADWVDKSLLRLAAADITRIDLAGMTLVRDKDGWRAADLKPDEEMVPDKVSALERAAASPLYDSILGKDAKPEDGLDKPTATLTLTLKDGRTVRYDLGKRTKGDDYALRVSGQPFLFDLPGYAAADLVGASRATLVRRKAAAADGAKGATRRAHG